MPRIQADRLQELARRLLIGAGASEEEAAIVSRHSIGANLAGHDSHGIILIPTYIDRILVSPPVECTYPILTSPHRKTR